MHLDPIMPPLVSTIFVILIATLVLKILRQPYVVAYLLAGVLIGPQGLGVISDRVAIDRLGAIGILLLLFFVGMEVSPHRLLQQWKIPIVGTLLQIAASVGCAALLGWALEWALCR
ncbi:MAG: cation:proton antiporter, partial [Polyangiales bacterium]